MLNHDQSLESRKTLIRVLYERSCAVMVCHGNGTKIYPAEREVGNFLAKRKQTNFLGRTLKIFCPKPSGYYNSLSLRSTHALRRRPILYFYFYFVHLIPWESLSLSSWSPIAFRTTRSRRNKKCRRITFSFLSVHLLSSLANGSYKKWVFQGNGQNIL